MPNNLKPHEKDLFIISDNHVEAIVFEIAYVGYLLFVAVVCGAYLYCRFWMEHYLSVDFVVLL